MDLDSLGVLRKVLCNCCNKSSTGFSVFSSCLWFKRDAICHPEDLREWYVVFILISI